MQRILRHPVAVPLLMSSIAAAVVVAMWLALRHDHQTKIANVTESTSYATRSELARRLGAQFRALRDLSEFWATYDQSQPSQRATDLLTELSQIEGLDLIAWSDASGTRFFARGANLALDREPTSAEWETMRPYFDEARGRSTQAMTDPERDADGHSVYRLYIPARREEHGGVLVALIDANEQLGTLLLDEAPGYQLRVSCCGGAELYRRGGAAAVVPEAWAREGWIEPSPITLWRVEHRPTAALAADFRSWAVDAVLIVGLAMALLIGAVVYEGKQARIRAVAASTAKQRVRALNFELEARVETRTRDLNEALADLNTISLSVSHDLRSPLNAASLLTHGLRQQSTHDQKTAECLDRITANIERMATIMDRLLGFSRVSSFEYRIEQVDMRTLAEQVVEEQSSELGSQAQITVGDLPMADADRTMIHILFTNLLGNALKHARNGGGERIEIGCTERGDERIYFVRDNGPGFDQDVAAELFKPKQQLRKSSERGGLGLGLAIAARIVERHGGKIWAQSQPGEGASFLFTLRASRGANTQDEK